MLAFVSVYLGLVAGLQPVELVAGPEAAAIEIDVAGERCARLVAPPWRATCDFGERPRPLRLTATAFDQAGREIGRVEQRLNVFRGAAEVEIVLERAADATRTARAIAHSLSAAAPRAVRIELDGAALPAADLTRIALPAVDERSPHLLRLEIDWGEGVVAVAERMFGGEYGEELSTELTAIPLDGAEKLPSSALRGRLTTPRGAAAVAALDRGLGELFVIALPDALPALRRLTASLSSSEGAPGARLGAADRKFRWALSGDDQARVLSPWPQHRTIDGAPHDLFPPSPPFVARDGGLIWILTRQRRPDHGVGPPQIADAVAVAGMTAAGRGRRRAVLLILGADRSDGSALAPAAARSLLAELRVPLHVWRTDRRGRSETESWGEVAEIASSTRLAAAFSRLESALDRQRVVWIEGSYLPNEIGLAPGTPGLRFSGAGAAP